MPAETPPRICLLGFGEVGQTLAGNFGSGTAELAAYDILFDDSESPPSRALQQFPAVQAADAAVAAAAGAGLVVSAVTASQDVAAAESVAAALAPGAWYLDLNSVAPATRQDVAAVVTGAGARYVEAAVMSPIRPAGAGSPMLLGGPHARAFAETAAAFGFHAAKHCSDEIGKASATKMCRSVIIKGLEALFSESLLAARRYGVEKEVLDSLSNLLGSNDWEQQALYLMSRSLEHGERRAEEMREAAATVSDAGIEPWMSRACAGRQARSAAYAVEPGTHRLGDLLDAILASAYSESGEQAGSARD